FAAGSDGGGAEQAGKERGDVEECAANGIEINALIDAARWVREVAGPLRGSPQAVRPFARALQRRESARLPSGLRLSTPIIFFSRFATHRENFNERFERQNSGRDRRIKGHWSGDRQSLKRRGRRSGRELFLEQGGCRSRCR